MSEPVGRQAFAAGVAAAILDGAAEIFAVQGERASMNDVADRHDHRPFPRRSPSETMISGRVELGAQIAPESGRGAG